MGNDESAPFTLTLAEMAEWLGVPDAPRGRMGIFMNDAEHDYDMVAVIRRLAEKVKHLDDLQEKKP